MPTIEPCDTLFNTFPLMLSASKRTAEDLDTCMQQLMMDRFQEIESAFYTASCKGDRIEMFRAAKALCALGERLVSTLKEQKADKANRSDYAD